VRGAACLCWLACGGAWLTSCGGAEPDGEPAFIDLVEDGANPSGASPNGGNAPSGSGSPVSGLPTDDAAPTVSGGRCTKVDFLFVVDNSLSMLEEQTALINSFPGFMQVVEDALGASDFHVMVVDTDAGDGRDAIAALLGQQGLDPCGPTLGAGRRQSQAGQDCGLANQRRYMDASQANLTAAFSCVAQVGTLGNPLETPVDAMLASIGPALNGPGGCNAGFLRDDAILVVTLIGDEDDGVSSGDPALWRDALVRAKGGNQESIVFLGLIGSDANPGATATCAEESDADPAPRLRSLIQSFPHGSIGDICSPEYAPFFADTVSVIDTACDEFDPVIR
jgi:hypothetical protein